MTFRVLVTGGSGQLGQVLEKYAESEPVKLTMLDIHPHRAGMLMGDVVDPDFMREVVSGHDAVVHAAALHGTHVKAHSVQRFLRTNVEGASSVLSACADAGVERVVLMSSTSVYGLSARRPRSHTVFVDENTPCHPVDINDLSKVLVEQVASYMSRQEGLPITVLRSGRFFVADEVDFNLAKLSGAVDAVDVAQAVFRSLLAPPPGFDVFCIASDTRFTISDVPRLSEAAADVIEERYPGAAAALATKKRSLPARLHRVVDISKAEERIGFKPTQNFDTFIGRLTDGLSRPAPETANAGHGGQT